MAPRGAFMRVGTSAEPMQQEQNDSLFAMRTCNSIGCIISNRQDFTFEQLRIYYDERGKRLNAQDDYTKSRNYWKYLKTKLKNEGGEVVSATNQLKMLAPDGKMRLADVLDYNGVISLAKSFQSVVFVLQPVLVYPRPVFSDTLLNDR